MIIVQQYQKKVRTVYSAVILYKGSILVVSERVNIEACVLITSKTSRNLVRLLAGESRTVALTPTAAAVAA